jgi:hypothetical protein
MNFYSRKETCSQCDPPYGKILKTSTSLNPFPEIIIFLYGKEYSIQQVSGFLRVLWFPPPITLTAARHLQNTPIDKSKLEKEDVSWFDKDIDDLEIFKSESEDTTENINQNKGTVPVYNISIHQY